VTTGDKYPQDLKFEVVKDKCSMLDDYKEGQDVQVNFDIRGNEYNGKYFVNLSCWKLSGKDGSSSGGGEYSQEEPAASGSSQGEPSAADLRKNEEFDDDDIPF